MVSHNQLISTMASILCLQLSSRTASKEMSRGYSNLQLLAWKMPFRNNCHRRTSCQLSNSENGELPLHPLLQQKEPSSSHLNYKPFLPIYYNDVYQVDLPPGHRFPMDKYRRVREALMKRLQGLNSQERSNVLCEFRISPLATISQLQTTHSPSYIQRYLSNQMTTRELRNIGFPWSVQHVKRSLSSVGGTMEGACTAWEEYIRRWKKWQQQSQITENLCLKKQNLHLCWAAHIAGGTHHAFYDYGEGFCIFSDIAVAANVLLQKYSSAGTSGTHFYSSSDTQPPAPEEQGQQQSISTHLSHNSPFSPRLNRILILDLDVHQGNGNAALFAHNPNVFTFSMHCRANYFSKKERSNVDVELPEGCGDETYLSTLKCWLKLLEKEHYQPPSSSGDAVPAAAMKEDTTVDLDTNYVNKPFDLIFFQAGVDIHKEDRLGRLSLTSHGITKRNLLVFEFAHRMEAPLIICMGGGYPRGEDWSSIVEAHTGVYWEAHQFLSSLYMESRSATRASS